MVRLPQPGSDEGKWGEILNEYLLESHTADGALKPATVDSIQLKPGAVTSDKIPNASITTAKLTGVGQADGIATLGSDTKLPEGQLPSRLSDASLTTKIDTAIENALDNFDPDTSTSTLQILQVGDSLTENWGNNSNNIEIKNAFGAANVQSIGKGGQTSPQIAARQGGRPVLLTISGGILSASGAVSVTPDSNLFYMNASSGTWSQTGTVAGVAGTLTLVKTSGTYAYTFTRSASGTQVAVPNATPFLTGFAWRNHLMTICIGRNDFTSSTPAEIVERIRGIIEWNRRDPSSHLVLSIPPSTSDTPGSSTRIALDAANAAIKAAFPRQWVDWAGYLTSAVTLQQAGVTPTSQDTTDIANGIVPASFRGDALHYNGLAYDMVNPLIVRELVARGATQTTEEPTPPEPQLHGYGLTDAAHRYVGASLPAIGQAATPWQDEIGSLDLALASTTMKVGAGPGGIDKSFDTPNTAATTNTQRIYNTTGDNTIRTIAVIYNNRTPATIAQDFVSVGSGHLKIARGANGVVFAGATGSSLAQSSGSAVAGWRVGFAWYNEATSEIGIDIAGSKVVVTTARNAAPGNTLAIGGAASQAIDIGIAEVILWNRVLSDSERTIVRSALTEHYPAIDA